MKGYFAIVRRNTDEDSYIVDFPDLPDCACEAPSVDEAFSAAKQALRGHAEELEAAGKPLPKPRPAYEMLTVASKMSGVAAACLRAPAP